MDTDNPTAQQIAQAERTAMQERTESIDLADWLACGGDTWLADVEELADRFEAEEDEFAAYGCDE